MILEIAKGLNHLHSQNILHRDLKSANILLNADGHAKLADFRIAKSHAKSIVSIHKDSPSLAWMPPEVLESKTKYSTASELYSFGVLLWEIVTGQHPGNDKEAIKRLQSKKTLPIPHDLPTVYTNILKGCWETEPQKRLILPEIINRIEEYQPSSKSSVDPKDIYLQGAEAERRGDDGVAKPY